VEAAQRFDPERGSFYSFAVPTVLGVLKRHFRDRSWDMRPPRRTQELANEIRRGWPYLVQDLGAIPSESDLASHLGASLAEVREARYASQGYSGTALDPSTEPDRETARSRVEGEIEARLLLARVWSELDPQDQHLIRLRFYDELSQVEIAKILGTSQMQISRYLARLLQKLRTLIGEEGNESIAS
jgi:RNA polymerase sigma-B factor